MQKLLLIAISILVIGAIGCNDETVRYIEVDNPPATPQGVYSITGDAAVYIFWLPVQADDLDHYNVYWSADDVDFEYVGSSNTNAYVDEDVSNGETYFYAIEAVDRAGNVSALSVESVFDTPRPESITFAYVSNDVPQSAGYDLSAQNVVAWDSPLADIYFDYDPTLQVMFINVGNVGTDIQDMGYSFDFDEIGYAPDQGWSDVGWSELILNHTYIIWTDNDHYAKIRPIEFQWAGDMGVRFEWAYQTDISNPELARPQHDDDFTNRTVNGTILR